MKRVITTISILMVLLPCLAFADAGYALQFDGVDDAVNCGGSSLFEPPDSLTIEAWFVPDGYENIANAAHLVVKKGSTSLGTYMLVLQKSDSSLYFNIYGDNVIVDITPYLGGWVHAAGVFDGQNMKLYMNGDLVGTTPRADSISYNVGSDLLIGADDDDNNNIPDLSWHNKIDEVRVWNIARSQEEIQATMSYSLSGNESGLVGYWKLDESSGDIAFDSSPHGNDGQLGILNGPDSHDPFWVVSTAPINEPRTWYISTIGNDTTGDGSQQNPFATIQHGIDLSSNGDTVLSEPGTYIENINFNGTNLVLGSLFLTTGDTSYISTTIIDGDSSGSVVTFANGEDSTAIIIGFTIQNGLAVGGGGINCDYAHPKIFYNIISNNIATNSDGGIRGHYSSPIIKNNIIKDNMTNGDGGGMRFAYGDPIIKHNLIVNNISNRGGGLYLNNNSPLLENNTISGNIADTMGGGLRTAVASPTVINCIIYNNTAPDGPEMSIWGAPIVSYSDIQDTLWPGVGNISCDPQFCDPDSGNFYLADTSCCVGTGQGGVDIGALGIGCGLTTIPTLSEWGMLIMGLLLLAVGTVAVIRKRKAVLNK